MSQSQAEHIAQCVLDATMPHINKIVDILQNHKEEILAAQHGYNELREKLEAQESRICQLEKGLDQVEVGLLVDKITVLEARLRDTEYELIKLRERDEGVPSPWK